MRPWEKARVNELGNMVFGGADCVELAKEYGTPLYVMDETVIRSVCRGFMDTIKRMGAKGRVMYASKALCTTAMYRIVESEGLGADVVSGGELYTALSAGFPADRIVFHGNNKTPAEIEQALRVGVSCLVIDSHEEIDLTADIAKRLGVIAEVSLRTKPGIEAHTHEYIMTGIDDCKFGLGLYDGEAVTAARQIASRPELKLKGLHCHIGSQIFEPEPFVIATERLTDFAKLLKDELGIEISEINFGGGFGIMYTEDDAAMEPFAYVQTMITTLREQCEKRGLKEPEFVIEPGRSIVGEAGITLYTVGTVKHIPNIRTYVSVDGGMGDNPRHMLYGAQYVAALANKPKAPVDRAVTVAGRCCESGDLLIKDAPLPECAVGDIMIVFSTGAYNYSMASNYNRVPIPAMVLVNEGRHALMVKRQTYEQLVENDAVPTWL